MTRWRKTDHLWFTASGGTVQISDRADGQVPVLIHDDGTPVYLERTEAIRVASSLLWRTLEPDDWEIVRKALASTAFQRNEDAADLEVTADDDYVPCYPGGWIG